MGEIKIEGYRCERCLHIWRARNNKPRVCPKCKSPYWDIPRKNKGKKKRKRKGRKN